MGIRSGAGPGRAVPAISCELSMVRDDPAAAHRPGAERDVIVGGVSGGCLGRGWAPNAARALIKQWARAL